MLFKLFMLFVILPIVELSILIKIGHIMGVFNTVMLILLTAMVGSFMVKMEGLNVLYRFQENTNRGIFPAEELFDGVLILIAGVLLITPGVVTDFIGFLFVFPASRGVIKKLIKKYLKTQIIVNSGGGGGNDDNNIIDV
ncbi:MAG: FxsA family protein [Nitrospinota bacterium]|nr:FxsA family protein [Nitrospinota bacterium]